MKTTKKTPKGKTHEQSVQGYNNKITRLKDVVGYTGDLDAIAYRAEYVRDELRYLIDDIEIFRKRNPYLTSPRNYTTWLKKAKAFLAFLAEISGFSFGETLYIRMYVGEREMEAEHKLLT